MGSGPREFSRFDLVRQAGERGHGGRPAREVAVADLGLDASGQCADACAGGVQRLVLPCPHLLSVKHPPQMSTVSRAGIRWHQSGGQAAGAQRRKESGNCPISGFSPCW